MLERLAQWLDAHASPAWREAPRLHSIWVVCFWAIISGLYAALPAFMYYMPPFVFAVLCIVFCLVLAIARFTKQPGMDE